MLKVIASEIKLQSEMMGDTIPKVADVLKEHKAFLQSANFELVTATEPNSSTLVTLKKTVPGGHILVQWDAVQIVQRSGQDYSGEGEDGDDAELYNDSGSMDNLEMQVEIVKDGLDKKLVLSCELDLGYDVMEGEDNTEEGESDSVTPSDASLYITDARIVPVNETTPVGYEGPDFSTLDEELQSSLTEYVEAQLGDLHELGSFIDSYSGSQEGAMYEGWLRTLEKTVQ